MLRRGTISVVTMSIKRALLVACGACAVACSSIGPRMGPSLAPFSADRPLAEYVRKAGLGHARTQGSYLPASSDCGDGPCVEEVVVTASLVVPDLAGSITNNQEAGVDEGDIVKRVGHHLVLLRRGRLFSFALPGAGSRLEAIDYIDVGSPAEDMEAWYDEILAYGSTIVLLGYSYDPEVSLVRLYELSDAGRLSAKASYFFSSSDYFDAENYSTRLVGSDLVFYMPRSLPAEGQGLVAGSIVAGELVGAAEAFTDEVVYQPILQPADPVLHTIARCPLDAPDLRCTATSFVGPWSRRFYISGDAVYLWLNAAEWAYDYFLMSDRYVRKLNRRRLRPWKEYDELAVVYRVPLDGGTPGVVQARGRPINQFSFRETAESLQVLTRAGASDNPILMDIPLRKFDGRATKIDDSHYEELPPLRGELTVNRFVGPSLLYDDVVYARQGVDTSVLVKDLRTKAAPTRIAVPHLAERLEPVGMRALVIGTDERTGLGITSLDPVRRSPVAGQTVWLPGALEADERSHAFNYLHQDAVDVAALPVVYAPAGTSYDPYWLDEPSSVHMVYYGMTPDLGLQPLGEIVGRVAGDDNCRVSCVDWYGDSRPFFIGERLFALLGYELIEGYVSGGHVYESRRVSGLDLLSAGGPD